MGWRRSPPTRPRGVKFAMKQALCRSDDAPAWRANRRSFIKLASLCCACCVRSNPSSIAQATEAKVSLLSAPLEINGTWGGSLPDAARHVVLRMREACLSGVRLLSDRQPEKLRVDNHLDGPPAVWLHADQATTAWVIVDIDPRDWSKLAYQFGHELGHVLCNSWNAAAKPRPPCQWLEEAMVEAFSIRGLGILAVGWARDPPFAGDAPFASSIRQYRSDLVERYRKAGGQPPSADLASWFQTYQATIEKEGGIHERLGPVLIAVLGEFESDKSCVEDLGALNRWPERSALPIADYLTKWQASCAEIKSSGKLPLRLKTWLKVG
jgi:hypothetical protein